MLIVFSGLPGTGKTTLARQLAVTQSATYLRIDTVEQAIRDALPAGDVGTAGYDVALALAAANLANGKIVVADCVNPVAASRTAWRATATRAACPLFNIEIICSNTEEHKRRVEIRIADIPGQTLPNWQSVQAHQYEPWLTERLVLDTAILKPSEALAIIQNHLGTN